MITASLIVGTVMFWVYALGFLTIGCEQARDTGDFFASLLFGLFNVICGAMSFVGIFLVNQ